MRTAVVLASLLVIACEPAAQPKAAVVPTIDAPRTIPPQPEALTPSIPDVLKASNPEEWVGLDPENTLYMEFPAGRVVIELAPDFAPNHVANVKTLSREGYFAGGAVTRVQDNYVTQWAQAADPARPPKKGVE